MVGFSLLMLMPDTVALATLPAMSVPVRVTDWFAPLALRVTSSGHTATPDRPSEQVKCTVTGPTYQPLPPLVPLMMAPLMLGAVLSSLIVTESVPRLPAVSFAEPLTTVPLVLVSVLTVTSGVMVLGSTPDPGSVSLASKCTVTLLLFQPAALAGGVTGCGAAGAVAVGGGALVVGGGLRRVAVDVDAADRLAGAGVAGHVGRGGAGDALVGAVALEYDVAGAGGHPGAGGAVGEGR